MCSPRRLASAFFWVLGMGSRFAFLVWISHGGSSLDRQLQRRTTRSPAARPGPTRCSAMAVFEVARPHRGPGDAPPRAGGPRTPELPEPRPNAGPAAPLVSPLPSARRSTPPTVRFCVLLDRLDHRSATIDPPGRGFGADQLDGVQRRPPPRRPPAAGWWSLCCSPCARRAGCGGLARSAASGASRPTIRDGRSPAACCAARRPTAPPARSCSSRRLRPGSAGGVPRAPLLVPVLGTVALAVAATPSTTAARSGCWPTRSASPPRRSRASNTRQSVHARRAGGAAAGPDPALARGAAAGGTAGGVHPHRA